MILKRLYLDSLKISNSQLAGYIGVSRKTISKIVNGRGAITPEMALRLSRALNEPGALAQYAGVLRPVAGKP